MAAEPTAKRQRTETWKPDSWRSLPVKQMAEWEDGAAAGEVFAKLNALPPLVQAKEVESLKSQLAAASRGEAFVIQGGDCAERFVDCTTSRLEAQIKFMLQLGLIIRHAMKKPAVVVCRLAGQYGKPRSSPTEKVDGVGEVMSFKGDNINGIAVEDRKLDPKRLVQGYFHSAATLNFVRSYLSAADPASIAKINVAACKGAPDFSEIESTSKAVAKAAAAGVPAEVFTAHEAMQLDLEESLTRCVAGKYYNLSAHMIWIGDRTRQLDHGHMEYFRGVSNPIGVKVGPSMGNDELKELVQILNPNKDAGRLVLITRYGAGKIEQFLPGHIEAVKASGIPVVWQCDAVHGNGKVASNKLKTRDASDILSELLKCIAVHKSCGSVLGGIHLECTAQESVTECLGGCMGISEEGLKANYETSCDPRLNYGQTIEIVHRVAQQSGCN